MNRDEAIRSNIVRPEIHPVSTLSTMGRLIRRCRAYRRRNEAIPALLMNSNPLAERGNPFITLRRLAQPRKATEQCEFCSAGLSAAHRHLLEVADRKVICACDACALRFENAVGRWKLIPRDPRVLSDFRLTDMEWEALALPINLAFFFKSTPAQRVVSMYPSPAGATESLLTLAAWESMVERNPNLAGMEADVEALLINRLHATREYYIAPIDRCFELVGLIRVHWRGLSGGDKVYQEIKEYFAALKKQSKSPEPARNVEAGVGCG